MKVLEKIRLWGEHHPNWLGILRISLGLILIWKGIAFTANLDVLASFLKETGITDKLGISVFINLIAQLIIIFHLVGGICIALGLRSTRLFCMLNLPVLVGALLFVNLKQSLFKPYSEFWLSLFVLLALICFLVEDNGAFAIEHRTKEAA